MAELSFDSIYRHGMLRVAVGVPRVRVADPAFNVGRTAALAQRASDQGAALVIFPELGISSYTSDDLFHQAALLEACTAALDELRTASRGWMAAVIVGAPCQHEGALYNAAWVLHRGRVLGVVPKTYLPNYREFYEGRYFTPAGTAAGNTVRWLGAEIPFGNDLLFTAPSCPGFRFHAEICEDLWVPIPPSSYAALGGATVLCNLSASNITIGKASYRKTLCASQSGRCVAAYLYAAAGPGESTTDLAWDGQALIYENAELLAESERFASDEQLVIADVDLERLEQERMRLTSFRDCAGRHQDVLSLRRIELDFQPPATATGLRRPLERFPYVPQASAERDARCYEAYNIQVHGLMQRLQATGIEKLVIGVSGGLDSTQALIVAARAMDRLGLPRQNALAYTLPGFATSQRTYDNAWALMRGLQVSAAEIDIRPSCLQMLRDLGHPFSNGEPVHDVTFENVQAGERTSHLFRLANHHGALVLGTGDLSELALGWNTYGVGDQMSHYNVNSSVPKTLIQYLIRWVIATGQFDAATHQVLQSIVDTEISPELVPGDGQGDQPAQSTEERIGPYELQDFHLYFISRYGFRPSKVAFLAHHAWSDRDRGAWPEELPPDKRHQYDLPTIKRWLEVFLFRFFQLSQFKRSAMPNAPKVGSGGSLSPRGDWRAPSDASAEAWLAELRRNVP